MSPADGERRLNSAIAPNPVRRERGPEAHASAPASENATSASRRSAAAPTVDCLACQADALLQICRVTPGRDRSCGVEQDRRPPPAVAALEHLADPLGVLRRSPAAELRRVTALDAELQWVDLALSHVAVDDLAHEIRPDGGELVDAAGAVHDERAARAELRQHVGDHGHQLRRVHAHDLRARAGRIRQWAEHVEDRSCRKLSAHRPRMLHRGMVCRREHEAEAELIDRLGDPLGLQVEPESELLEHVGRARGAMTPSGCRASPLPLRQRLRRAPRRSRC